MLVIILTKYESFSTTGLRPAFRAKWSQSPLAFRIEADFDSIFVAIRNNRQQKLFSMP